MGIGQFLAVGMKYDKQAESEEYLKEHIGERLYFKIGDLTVSSLKITENTTSDKLIFEGFDLFGRDVYESKK